MGLTILTVATKNGGYFEILKRSCAKYGLNLIIVGFGEVTFSWVKRLEWIHDTMVKLPKNEIVMVVDAFDVFFLAGADEIVRKFTSLQTPLLVGGDNQCNSKVQQTFAKIFFNRTGLPYSDHEYSLVCAGTFVTTPSYFCENIYEKLHYYTKLYDDDQIAFTSLALIHPELLTIDVHCVLFQTMFPCLSGDLCDNYSLRITKDRVHNIKYDTYPILIHGGGNNDLCSIVIKLYPDYDCKGFSNFDRWKKTLSYVPQFCDIFKIEIAVIVIALVLIIVTSSYSL